MVPCVGGEISRDDLDQGRLAGPIVADQADDLAGCHGIVDLGERANGAELHADAAQLQKGSSDEVNVAATSRATAPRCVVFASCWLCGFG
jgi:hypothetical protein